jgi:hypothetical protein
LRATVGYAGSNPTLSAKDYPLNFIRPALRAPLERTG